MLGNTPEPVYTLGSDWSGSGYGVPYSREEFRDRFKNAPHVGQAEEPVLPTITVTDRRESDLGKVADIAIDLTPFGYLVSVRNSVAGRTLVGNEELGPWERMLGIIPIVGSVRKIGKRLNIFEKTESATKITFKTSHYTSRLEAVGINVRRAESAVANEVSKIRNSLVVNADAVGRLRVDTVLIEYRARLLENGTVNIGTIFPVK